MSRIRTKLLIAKFSLIAGAVPIVMHAYEYGPLPFRTGAPGDTSTCLASGCHSGTLNSMSGSVRIVLPGGNTYTPGVKQHIMVQITDPTRQKFGFQLQARAGGGASAGQAGDFTPTDSMTQVICGDGGPKPCSVQSQVQFIEHTLAGYTASTPGAYTYQFDWMPPTANIGDITMYVAANAGPGGAPTNLNANIYTTNVTLAGPSGSTGPLISNLLDAEGGKSTLVPGEWAAVYGTNLYGGAPRTWGPSDFTNGNNLPTVLSGVTVFFGGIGGVYGSGSGSIAAPVFYISPTQIDVQIPAELSGSVPVVVDINGVQSPPFNIFVGSHAPTIFYYPAGNKVYAVAQHADGSLIGDPSVMPNSTKARPGETIVIYVNGLAPSPSGMILGAIAYNDSPVTVSFGSTTTTASYAGVAFAGGFQVNVVVPAGLAPGDYALTVSTAGQSSQSGITLPMGP